MTIKDPPNVLPFKENNPPPKKDLRLEAERWIAENPTIYKLFCSFARDALNRRRKFGIGALTERVRWEVNIHWKKDERGFRINNNHRAYIARKLLEDMPDLEGLLEVRKTYW